MKLNSFITLCVTAFGLVAARAQDVKFTVPNQGEQPANAAPAAASTASAEAPAPAAATPAAAPAKPAFGDEQIAEELGWFYGKKMGLAELSFSKSEIDALVKGLTTAAAGKDSPYELDKIGPTVDEFLQKKQAAYVGKLKQKNTADNVAFFNKLKENKNIVELPDGLRYEIVKPGEGAYPKPEDTVKVHYTGTLLDGTVFDSSVQRGQPAEFALKEVIPGWTEGIQKINKGGKIKLYVPPQLGYGDEGNQRIPPGATLIFDVELLDINPPAAPAAAAPGAPAPAAEPTAK